jgi:2-dehydro-3-deoxyphosphogluconate aldolase / (4S)-4-hydroxy-2-oxoglutarate aldolase
VQVLLFKKNQMLNQSEFDLHHQNKVRSKLSEHAMIPVVTFNDVKEAIPIMEKIISKGVRCIEVTLRTPCAEECIAIIKSKFGSEVMVGAGTVINSNQVKRMIELNVDFMVSPGFSENLIDSMQASGIAYLPGVATPGEMIKAQEKNCYTLKFFPANLFGGLAALKVYAGLFPNVLFCPTGGISQSNYEEYQQQSNVISVGGSWITNS